MKKHIDYLLIFSAILLVVLITGISFITGYLSNNGYTQFEYKIFSQAYEILESNGLKSMPPGQTTEYEMIRGLVKAYDDPFTVFVEPVQHEIDSNQLDGKFGGIGVEIQRDSDGNIRLYPYPVSPAADAGLPEGCILLSVDNLTITPGTPNEDVVSALRGEIGSEVTVTYVVEPGGTSISKLIKRSEFSIPSVTWHLLPENQDLGLVKITGMAATTAAEIIQGVDELVALGADSLILDFRGNGGGLVDAGVEVAELFTLDNTPIITLHYPDKSDQIKISRGTGPFPEIPLYIFIDQNTASSAEIVVGALQSAGRATVIGARSYGKDTIQLVFDLQDGSSIHVSAARWSLPENPFFGSNAGIEPDIPLPSDQLTDKNFVDTVLQIYGSK